MHLPTSCSHQKPRCADRTVFKMQLRLKNMDTQHSTCLKMHMIGLFGSY